ncbi:MAG: SIS domain-containing protein [Vicinamibacterales bacterium]|nr:SIS domain-containing protein [Vicinamibacterales bacterium]
MTERRRAAIDRGLEAASAAHLRLRGDGAGPIAAAAGAIVEALGQGRMVLVFGNGGSAADAQHFAAELAGRFVKERRGWPAVALTTDTSALTAIGNDYGFAQVFARQVEALGRAGDVAIGITTSGASPNVVAALDAARARGLVTIALTGRDGGAAGQTAAIHVNVAETVTARIQEVHMTVLHLICEIVDEELS